MSNSSDSRYLRRTLELAKKGQGSTKPNPLVGAVITKAGKVIAEGYHAQYGGPHAEIAAINAASEADLVGSTLYVSMEPCCHHGKTAPCTEAIIKARIKRVVVGSDDPSEKAAGQGLEHLRAAGIEVKVTTDKAVLNQAKQLNQPFRKHAVCGQPFVTYKVAMTLDGKVATETNDSKWISCGASRQLVQRLRAYSDAVAVGIGTVLADDPLLTARTDLAVRQPKRVIFDSLGRLSSKNQLMQTITEAAVAVVVSTAARPSALQTLERAGAEIIVARGDDYRERIDSALTQLGSQQVTSLLLEGGPTLAGAFMDCEQIDQMKFFIAPLIIGSKQAYSPIEGKGKQNIAAAIDALSLDCRPSDNDLLISASLKQW